MKIAVLIKQVPGAESPLQISSDQKWVDESAVAYVMNCLLYTSDAADE